MITVKQMAAWAQSTGADRDCSVYKFFVENDTWEKVIKSPHAMDFLAFFQRRMPNGHLGVNWDKIDDIKIPAKQELTLEERFAKDIELTSAQRLRDDKIKASGHCFNLFYRDRDPNDMLSYRKASRANEDATVNAEREYEDKLYDIEAHYKKLLEDKQKSHNSVLDFIPEFMRMATITRDWEGDPIARPDDCRPNDVYIRAKGLDE